MTEQVRSLEESPGSVIRPNQCDSVLIFPDSFFQKAHLLICNTHLVMRIEITVIYGVEFIYAKFVSDLGYIERLRAVVLSCYSVVQLRLDLTEFRRVAE